MTPDPTTAIPALKTLPLYPYIDAAGHVAANLQGCIGVYAIFDAAAVLQYIGYSRDLRLSLQQHLVRCPQECRGYKVVTIERPDRARLQAIEQAWIAEIGAVPQGNAAERSRWETAIDVRPLMTTAEKEALAAADPLQQPKLLKQVARRIEAEIMAQLQGRSLKETLIFNPKLKESGRLDLK